MPRQHAKGSIARVRGKGLKKYFPDSRCFFVHWHSTISRVPALIHPTIGRHQLMDHEIFIKAPFRRRGRMFDREAGASDFSAGYSVDDD